MGNDLPSISGKFLEGGQWRKAKKRTQVINPANFAEAVGEVGLCSREEVAEAIDAAEKAFAYWSISGIHDRENRIREAARQLEKAVPELERLYVRENGKVLPEARRDLLRCVELMHEAIRTLQEWWSARTVKGQQLVQFRKRPRGVTAVITPWNSPMILTFKRVIPAILTGNTVVVKPATSCPLTVLKSLEIIVPYFPPGVINVITGSGGAIGNMLCSDPRIRTIAFVGSTATGKEILRLSCQTVKKVYMELGGNDPALILQDAILDEEAVRRLRAGVLRAAGQVCSAIKRIYVHESRYQELVDKLKAEFANVVVGNGLDPESMMGPLQNRNQYIYVQGLLERAAGEGAHILRACIKRNPEEWTKGYFMEPAIVTNVSQQSEIVRVEQFGPVIPILPFKDEEEAVKLANDSVYGLRASVWTADREKAAALADRLEAGAVFHNHHTIFQDLRIDFPGIKESGLSRETQNCALDLFADTYGFAE